MSIEKLQLFFVRGLVVYKLWIIRLPQLSLHPFPVVTEKNREHAVTILRGFVTTDL
jgi:hypothetical protein